MACGWRIVKFTYAYKTSDGVRHENSMKASSREEVFQALRAQGIKAIKVVALDGSKANGETRGVRKRVVAASIIGAAIIVGLTAFFVGRSVPPPQQTGEDIPASPPTVALSTPPVAYRNAKPLARQAINGDRQRIEAAMASLTNAAERLLAAFAEPGRPVPELGGNRPADAEFEVALRNPIRIPETDFTEAVDLKRIVAKMKSDLRRYLADGGTIDGYIEEMVKRQKLEVSYREKAENNLARLCSSKIINTDDRSEAYDYWLKANAHLQTMGIYPLPLPDALRGYEATLDLDE